MSLRAQRAEIKIDLYDDEMAIVHRHGGMVYVTDAYTPEAIAKGGVGYWDAVDTSRGLAVLRYCGLGRPDCEGVMGLGALRYLAINAPLIQLDRDQSLEIDNDSMMLEVANGDRTVRAYSWTQVDAYRILQKRDEVRS